MSLFSTYNQDERFILAFERIASSIESIECLWCNPFNIDGVTLWQPPAEDTEYTSEGEDDGVHIYPTGSVKPRVPAEEPEVVGADNEGDGGHEV